MGFHCYLGIEAIVGMVREIQPWPRLDQHPIPGNQQFATIGGRRRGVNQLIPVAAGQQRRGTPLWVLFFAVAMYLRNHRQHPWRGSRYCAAI
ncbi:hypothetical protein D3C85_1134300 [compost metagenome]